MDIIIYNRYCVFTRNALHSKFETKYNNGWKGQSIHSYSDSVFSKGVSIYFRENFDVKIVNVKIAIDGRKILINVELNGYIFSLINIYAPSTGSKGSEFFKNLQCFITKHCLNDNILICGDFNCQLNDEKDKSVHILKKMIDKLRLTDLWKKTCSNLNGLTWCDAENNPKSRIDYILIN